MRVEEEFGLKPCPFCGKEAVLHAETIQRTANGMIPITIMGIDVYETRTYTTVTVGCSDDGCIGRAHDPNTISFWDITSAVNAWNTRAGRDT